MQSVVERADVDQATATWLDGQVTLQAAGNVHESCWAVEIEQSPLDVWPPQFVVNRHRTSPICTQVVTPYVVADCFVTGSRPDEVTLIHAGGDMQVPVEDPPVALHGDYDEAEGRSRRRFSFDEAFANAVEALPVPENPIPDGMDTVVVTEIHGELGGIAGSRDLVVRVRRARPPA